MRARTGLLITLLVLAGCKDEPEVPDPEPVIEEPDAGTPPPAGRDAGPNCVPKTCTELEAECGRPFDGCGKILECGECQSPNVCGLETPFHCTCVKTTCEALGKTCGQVSDGCGGTLECGTCESPLTCGGAGVPNACGRSCLAGCPSGFQCDRNGVCAGGDPAELVLDVKSFPVSGAVKINGSAPQADAQVCTAGLEAATVTFVESLRGYSIATTIPCNTSDFTFSTTLYPGTYRVLVKSHQYGETPSSTLPVTGDYLVQEGLEVSAAVENLELDLRTFTVSGKVTLNGVIPTPNPAVCDSPDEWAATVLLTDAARGYQFLDRIKCDSTTFTYTATVFPGSYELRVLNGEWDGHPASNLLPGLSHRVRTDVAVTAADLADIDLDLQVFTVSGKVTVQGALPTVTPECQEPAKAAFVRFEGEGAPQKVEIPCNSTDFSYAASVYPGSYTVRVGSEGRSNVPTTVFLAETGLQVAADIAEKNLDIQSVTVAGSVLLDSAAPPADCTGAAVRFREKTKGYDFATSVDCSSGTSGAYSTDLFPGTYQVTVTGIAPEGTTLAGAYLVNEALVVETPRPSYGINVRTATVEGRVRVNGMKPTVDAATCAQAGNAVTVSLLNSLGAVDYTVPCDSADFTFGGTVYAGDYAVWVEGTSQEGQAVSAVPNVRHLAVDKMAITGTTPVAIALKTLTVSGKLTHNSSTPLIDAAVCVDGRGAAAVRLGGQNVSFRASVACSSTDFAFSATVYPGQYRVQVENVEYTTDPVGFGSNLPRAGAYLAAESLRIAPGVWAQLVPVGSTTENAGAKVELSAQLVIVGVTDGAGQGAGVTAEVGWGATGTSPAADWTWLPATYAGDGSSLSELSDDVYEALVTMPEAGTYDFAFRFTQGEKVVLADLNGSTAYSADEALTFTTFDDSLLTNMWCNLQWPYTMELLPGTMSPTVYNQIWIAGITNKPGPGVGVVSELGIGPGGSDPRNGGWVFKKAEFNPGYTGTDNDEFQATFIAPSTPGTYAYTYRVRTDKAWLYCDQDGTQPGTLPFDPTKTGVLTVQ